jgi:hypothetical protein
MVIEVSWLLKMNKLSLMLSLGLSIICPILLGRFFLKPWADRRWNNLGIEYLLGMGIITHIFVLSGWLGISLSTTANLIFLFSLIVAVYFLYHPPAKPSFTFSSFSIIEILLTSYITIAVLYVLWTVLSRPIYAYDSITTEAFRAKVFFWNNSLEPLKYAPFPSFPLQIPLTMTWTALCLGRWHDTLIALPFFLVFLSVILINYHILREFMTKTWALTATALLCSSNYFLFSGTITYRDLWMMACNAMTVGMILLWNKEHKCSSLLLAGIFAGLGTFVKLEGYLYAVVLSITMAIAVTISSAAYKEKLKAAIKFILPLIGISLFYFLYKELHVIPVNEKAVLSLLPNLSNRMQECIQRFCKEMLLIPNWNVIWFVFFMNLGIHSTILAKNKHILLLLICLFLFLFSLFLTASLTINFDNLLHPDTLSRIFLHFFFLPVWILTFIHYTYVHDLKQKTT